MIYGERIGGLMCEGGVIIKWMILMRNDRLQE
jgi:hypothetical protein